MAIQKKKIMDKQWKRIEQRDKGREKKGKLKSLHTRNITTEH